MKRINIKFFQLLIVFFAVLFFSTQLNAQIETEGKRNRVPVKAKFYQDFLNFNSGNPDETRVDVFIQVPYTEILFIKSDAGFSASYTVTLSVFDESKEKIIVEKIWTEKVDAIDFDQTISKNNYNLSLRNFYLKPGKYFIRSSVEDKESKKTYASENIFVVRDLRTKPSISDIMLISKQTSTEKTNKILPNISRNIASLRDGIPLFFEIYSDSARSVKINYRILDQEQKEVFRKDTVQYLDTGKTQIFHTISGLELGLGTYLINVYLDNDELNPASSVSKHFVSRWIGVPSVINDLDKAIDQLIYIASGDEISKIKDAETQVDKVKEYMEFWKKKDPTPGTEENEIFDEYYRRIAYANESFSHYIDGWRTDRGMVFIILGAPNNVDRHPFDYDSKPYEVWEYYELNKEFVFVDETGFGDYRLITPLYGDFYRFR